jgi:hypothetical protein
MAALRALGQRTRRLQPDRCPVLSCNVTECELPALGAAAEGLVAAGPYFRGVPGWPGAGNFGSSHEAAAFSPVSWSWRGCLTGQPGAEALAAVAAL